MRTTRQRRADADRQRRLVMLAAAGVVLVLAVLVVAKLLTSGGSPARSEGPVPPEVMADLTSVLASTFEAVGRGGVQTETSCRCS